MRLLAAVLVLSLTSAPAFAQVVLDGKPTVKVASGEGGTERVSVSEPNRTAARVVILKRGGRYIWASRDNRELVHSVSGAFHYFVAPAGGGYVKVIDSTRTESPREPGPRFRYMEHLNLMLGTITYWGGSDDFHLHADELGQR